MLLLRPPLRLNTRQIRRLYSSQNVPSPVPFINGPLNSISVDEFRTRAFVPEKPLLITASDGQSSGNAVLKASVCAIPAAEKWFNIEKPRDEPENERAELSQSYLSPFASTTLPYELIVPSKSEGDINTMTETSRTLSQLLKHYTQLSPGTTFHQFSAPLSLFLFASTIPSLTQPDSRSQFRPQLYIAQAQLLDLPPPLRADLPTPHLVFQAGKGDIYDSNLWLGLPPTYTPLHKDPNPNLFIQLAGRKRVRILEPIVGGGLFRRVQERIGRAEGGGALRGSEMMEGEERGALWDAIWGADGEKGGYEALVGPGDALFIPKGWWHSLRSDGDGVTGSVNWWFR